MGLALAAAFYTASLLASHAAACFAAFAAPFKGSAGAGCAVLDRVICRNEVFLFFHTHRLSDQAALMLCLCSVLVLLSLGHLRKLMLADCFEGVHHVLVSKADVPVTVEMLRVEGDIIH